MYNTPQALWPLLNEQVFECNLITFPFHIHKHTYIHSQFYKVCIQS